MASGPQPATTPLPFDIFIRLDFPASRVIVRGEGVYSADGSEIELRAPGYNVEPLRVARQRGEAPVIEWLTALADQAHSTLAR